MTISAETVKKLREQTGVGMMDCKKALGETGGDFEAAVDYLRKKGLAKAAKRAERTAAQGVIGSYIHTGASIGVLVELNCETDFVARNEEFAAMARDIAMHVAASSPKWVKPEDVPAEVLEHEKQIYMAEARESGKPEAMLERIAEGKLKKFYEDNCLIHQKFIKDPEKSISDMMGGLLAKMGEKIEIGRFIRFKVGEIG